MKIGVYLRKRMVLMFLATGLILGLGACGSRGEKEAPAAEAEVKTESDADASEEAAASEISSEAIEEESQPESAASEALPEAAEEGSRPENEASEALPEAAEEESQPESAASEALPETEDGAEAEDLQEAAMYTLKAEETADIKLGEDGAVWQIRYDYAWDDYGTVDFNLTVNDRTEAFMPGSLVYSEIESVYVCDIDRSDDYFNILVDARGDNDIHTTCLFGFNEDEICLISECDGTLIAEEFTGGGTITVESRTGMFLRDYGAFVLRSEIRVHDQTAETVNEYSGRRAYDEDWEEAFFQEEFLVPLNEDLTVYEDSSCSAKAGVIPKGSTIDCRFAGYQDYMFLLQVSSEDFGGFIIADALLEVCEGIYFAG